MTNAAGWPEYQSEWCIPRWIVYTLHADFVCTCVYACFHYTYTYMYIHVCTNIHMHVFVDVLFDIAWYY